MVQAENQMLVLVWISPSRSHASRSGAGELTDVVTHLPHLLHALTGRVWR